MDEEHNEKKVVKTVLPSHLGGGPHGLGDPNDQTLRRIEAQVSIPQLMRAEAKKLCSDLVDEFVKCGKENGFMMPFKCRKEAREMQLCQLKWVQDPEFYEKFKEIYLKERSEYRATGIPKKMRRKENASL